MHALGPQPQPHHQGQYVDLARNRPGDICVHAAVCSGFQKVHWLSSTAVGGIIEFMTDEFRQRWHKEVKVGCVQLQQCSVQALGWRPLSGGAAE